MKKRRVVSLAAAASLLMVNGAYAAVPGNSVVLGNKAFDISLLFKDENIAEIQKAVGESNGALYYNLNDAGFKTIFENTPVTNYDNWPQITYKNAAGVESTYAEKNGDLIDLTKLTVSSVSAINATTIRVTLNEAPTTAPTVGDFKILVDSNTVAATAVAKVANQTKQYDLTIPTLGSNEGSLVVNDKAAAIDGSDFGYDFKTATIVSVTGVDKNHVNITFSEKVNKTDAETVGNYELLKASTGLKLDGAATVAPTLAKLQADGKTVLLTTDGAMATFAKGYIATVKTGVKDVKGNATTAAQSTFFDGVGSASTQAPAVLSTVYNPSTTATVVMTFDKDINATIDKTKIKVGGSALALGDTVSRTGVAQLTITMTAATKTAYEASADKTVVLEAGSVKDTETTPNVIGTTTLTPVEAARLTAAAYDEASNKLTMTFNKSINISTIDLTKVTLNGDVLTAASTTVNKLTQTANSATLEFTLSNAGDLTAVEGAATTSRGLVIAAGFAKDVDGNNVADLDYKAALTYTDDTTAPTVNSITYNATTNTMIITANEDVTIPDLDKIELYNGTTKLFDFETQKAALATGGSPIADGEASAEKKYTIVFSGAAQTAIEASSVDKNNIKVKFLQAGTTGQEALKDTAGNILAKDAEVSVNVVYTDQDAITLSGAISQVAADKVQLSFNKKVNTSDATNVSKYKVVKKGSSPEVVLPVLTAVASGDGTAVILTLDKNNANYVNGYTYEVTSTVTDTFGNNYATPATATDDEFTLDTTTSATAYKLTGVTFVDTVADYAYGAGDQLKLAFNGPVSLSGDVVVGDFDLANMTLGTGFTVAQGASTAELVVTLGTGAALTGAAFNNSQTIDLAAAGQTHVVGANGIAAVENGANIPVAKPDTTNPKVVSAKYFDANANGTQDAGDTLEITFDENVKFLAEDIAAGTSASGVDFLLDGSASLVLDGTKASVVGKIFTAAIKTVGTAITPGTTTIQGGDDAPNAVLDLWGNALVNDAGKVIAKSDTVQPTFSNVRITKGTSNTGTALEAGDKVIFSISEPVHKEASFDLKSLVFYAGSTPIAYNTDNHLLIDSADAGNNGTGANTSAVVIDNLAKTVTITIAANDGWEAATISSLSTFNIVTLGKPTFADANGNEVQSAAGFGLTVTK